MCPTAARRFRLRRVAAPLRGGQDAVGVRSLPQDKAPVLQSSAQRRSQLTTPDAFSFARPRFTLLSLVPAAWAIDAIDGNSAPVAKFRKSKISACKTRRPLRPSARLGGLSARRRGLAFEAPRLVIEPHGLLLRQGLKLHLFAGAVAPYRPRGGRVWVRLWIKSPRRDVRAGGKAAGTRIRKL